MLYEPDGSREGKKEGREGDGEGGSEGHSGQGRKPNEKSGDWDLFLALYLLFWEQMKVKVLVTQSCLTLCD